MSRSFPEPISSSPLLPSSPPLPAVSTTPAPTPRTRPNRFQGPPQTWRGFTAEERGVAESLEQQANQDLSVQLFNVHVLRRNGMRMREEVQKRRREKGEDVLEFPDSDDENNMLDDTYVPPKGWTAWPVRKDRLPKNLRIGPNGDDSSGTFRGPTAEHPREVVKEEIVAAILKIAKDRFHARVAAEKKIQKSIEVEEERSEEEGSEDDDLTEDDEDESESASEEEESEDCESEDNESEDDEDEDDGPYYEIIPSADDDLSERLLRPSVNHILSQLDNLLRVLHNNRLATISYLHDDESSLEEDEEEETPKVSKSTPKSTSTTTCTNKVTSKPTSTTPTPIDPSLSTLPSISTYPTVDDIPPGQPSPSKPRQYPPSTPLTRTHHRSNWLATWHLRTWHDILAAAAYASFPPTVLHRTAQRCADLFSSSIPLTTLHETPLFSLSTPIPPITTPLTTTTTIHPRPPQTRHHPLDPTLTALTTGLEPPFSPSVDLLSEHNRLTMERLTRHGSTSTRLFYCPIPTCKRSTEGFPRFSNFSRHLQLVHEMTPPPPPSRSRSRSRSRSKSQDGRSEENTDTEGEGAGGDGGGEVDSEDEMDGAVHVDGFLKEFRLKRGWRGQGEKTGSPAKRRKRH